MRKQLYSYINWKRSIRETEKRLLPDLGLSFHLSPPSYPFSVKMNSLTGYGAKPSSRSKKTPYQWEKDVSNEYHAFEIPFRLRFEGCRGENCSILLNERRKSEILRCISHRFLQRCRLGCVTARDDQNKMKLGCEIRFIDRLCCNLRRK